MGIAAPGASQGEGQLVRVRMQRWVLQALHDLYSEHRQCLLPKPFVAEGQPYASPTGCGRDGILGGQYEGGVRGSSEHAQKLEQKKNIDKA